jgi:hypothetical protein
MAVQMVGGFNRKRTPALCKFNRQLMIFSGTTMGALFSTVSLETESERRRL